MSKITENFAWRSPFRALAVAVMLGGIWLAQSLTPPARAAESSVQVPAPTMDEARVAQSGSATAVFAGGCFWGVQGVFQHVRGVKQAVSGYDGGAAGTADYASVSSGKTGHAESVSVTYDPSQITYGRLLQIFFSVAHDPTELNRQGPDYGTQYRSAIFPQNTGQARIAQAYIKQLGDAHVYRSPIVTRIEAGKTFYPAESYHQNYLVEHPYSPYIVANDLPKVRDLAREYPQLYRDNPVLVATSAGARR